MPLEVVATTWWLDSSVLPDLLWARLEIYGDGAAEILDLDGRRYRFPNEAAAASWLREDEYDRLDDLVADGDVASTVQPPDAGWPHAH